VIVDGPDPAVDSTEGAPAAESSTGPVGYRPRRARALSPDEIRAMVSGLDLTTLAGLRDKALILTAFSLALRVSDAIWLNVEDLSPAEKGFDVTIALSKTDQEGAGEILPLPYGRSQDTCPVTALRAYLTASGLAGTRGALFRAVGKGASQRLGTGRIAPSSVRRILHRAAARAEVDLTGLSTHSLRRGAATALYRANVPEKSISALGRWSTVSVLRGYDDTGRWENPASGHLGL
jgi:integrase